jgi:hypothetical protein
MTPEQAVAFLRERGWDMSRPADVCYLDCSAPGYLKQWDGTRGRCEIILCREDALVFEAGALDGDYSGALTPADSCAAEWPVQVLAGS